jgi:hypothetical protein
VKLTPVPVIEQRGTEEHPRFVIVSQDGGKYWNGSAWGDEKESRLYEDINEVAWLARAIHIMPFNDLDSTHYVVPLLVEVKSETPINMEVLTDWLISHAHVNVDYTEEEHGPKGSCVLLVVDWGGLTPKEQNDVT